MIIFLKLNLLKCADNVLSPIISSWPRNEFKKLLEKASCYLLVDIYLNLFCSFWYFCWMFFDCTALWETWVVVNVNKP